MRKMEKDNLYKRLKAVEKKAKGKMLNDEELKIINEMRKSGEYEEYRRQ